MTVLLATGCSNPREDVRVTLCKDIVLTRMGASTNLTGADARTKGYEHAAVSVRFSSQGRDAEAVCYYNHNSVDDTAIELSDPLAAYATSPFKVTIDGQRLTRSAMAESVKQAMLKQGREFVDRAKREVEQATRY